MAYILNIETATPLCSVALALDGNTVAYRETSEEKSHAGSLTVFIEELLKEKHAEVTDLDAIAVGKGPGSYTGLRIGVSVAKGLCYGANIPFIAVNTLQILFAQVMSDHYSLKKEPGILYCPMIDARRMEVYCCLLDDQGTEIEPIKAKIIDTNSFVPYLRKYRIAFFGSGMEKCRNALKHPNAIFIPDAFPHASALAHISESIFQKQIFEDIAYFEPFYLKDFIATVSKKGLQV